MGCLKKLDANCPQVSPWAGSKPRQLPANHRALGLGGSCLTHCISRPGPSSSYVANRRQSEEQTTGRLGEIKGKLAISPDAGAGPDEDWARNTPPGEVEAAEPERSLAKKPLLEESLLRTLICIK